MPETNSENALYRQLNAEMRAGLKNIYHQASSANQTAGHPTDALFTEASGELDEVVKTTESAAMRIMEIIEKQQDDSQEAENLLAGLQTKFGNDPDICRLAEICRQQGNERTELLTTLSFQDITGQRIKKVVNALAAIENSVLELYLASGLMLEAAEKEPKKDVKEIKIEAHQAVSCYKDACKSSELKGPDKNAPSQAAIDDMLAQLGL